MDRNERKIIGLNGKPIAAVPAKVEGFSDEKAFEVPGVVYLVQVFGYAKDGRPAWIQQSPLVADNYLHVQGVVNALNAKGALMVRVVTMEVGEVLLWRDGLRVSKPSPAAEVKEGGPSTDGPCRAIDEDDIEESQGDGNE